MGLGWGGASGSHAKRSRTQARGERTQRRRQLPAEDLAVYAAASGSKLGSIGRGAPVATLDVPSGIPAKTATQCSAPDEDPKNMCASRRRCGARSLRQRVAPMW